MHFYALSLSMGIRMYKYAKLLDTKSYLTNLTIDANEFINVAAFFLMPVPVVCYYTQHDLHDIMCCVPYNHLLPKYSF